MAAAAPAPHFRPASGGRVLRPQTRVDMDGGQPTIARGGGTHGSLAYFSLDLYVEAIEEVAVTCKVPAVSFEFLEFPPIKIFSALAEPIQTSGKLRAPFEQGKSCIFEMIEHEVHAALR